MKKNSSNSMPNSSLSDANIAQLMVQWIEAVNAKDTETAYKIKKELEFIRNNCPNCTI